VETPAIRCATPNQHATPARLDLYPSLAVVSGYQNFTITPWSLTPAPETPFLGQKREMLRFSVIATAVRGRTMLDLGASAGFFALWALREGATAATCVDMDPEYVEMTRRIGEHLQIDNLQSVHANVDTWDTPAGVVFALALVHWLYSCTSLFGSLDAVVGKLAALAQHALVVEWIEPEDASLAWFRHTDWNRERTDGVYDVAAFEAALGKHFATFQRLGETMPHRTLYVARKTVCTVDATNPLPLLQGRGEVISSRLVMPIGGIDYWSRVYDDRDGGRVTKQATLDLAAREARFLNGLASAYFPRVFAWERDEHASIVVVERINGERLADAAPAIRSSLHALTEFALHCVGILEALHDAQIWHRDVHIDNIIMRDGRPVLLDFGWAISLDTSYDNPEPLFAAVPDHDGVHTDTVKMGLVIEAVNAGAFREISLLSELMCHARSALRLTDLAAIRSILLLLQDSQHERQPMNEADALGQARAAGRGDDPSAHGRPAQTLNEMLVERNRKLSLYEQRLDALAATVAARDATIAEIDGQRVRLERESRDREQQHRDREGQRDAERGSLRAALAQRDAELAGLRAALAQRDAELAALRSQLSMIQGSRAWRLASAAGTMRRKVLGSPQGDGVPSSEG
jgi:hypothetical protein